MQHQQKIEILRDILIASGDFSVLHPDAAGYWVVEMHSQQSRAGIRLVPWLHLPVVAHALLRGSYRQDCDGTNISFTGSLLESAPHIYAPLLIAHLCHPGAPHHSPDHLVEAFFYCDDMFRDRKAVALALAKHASTAELRKDFSEYASELDGPSDTEKAEYFMSAGRAAASIIYSLDPKNFDSSLKRLAAEHYTLACCALAERCLGPSNRNSKPNREELTLICPSLGHLLDATVVPRRFDKLQPEPFLAVEELVRDGQPLNPVYRFMDKPPEKPGFFRSVGRPLGRLARRLFHRGADAG